MQANNTRLPPGGQSQGPNPPGIRNDGKSGGGIRSISLGKTNDKVFELVTKNDLERAAIIDVGAGEGHFSQKLGNHIREKYAVAPATILKACDLFPGQFKYRDITCDPVNINQSLPYADQTFDIACSIEVIEHIENQYAYARELYRICKENGRVFITTPNTLNINSRIKYFHSGFLDLFGPMPISRSDPVHVSGHIHPVTFYYLSYILYKTGFKKITLHTDRFKRSGLALILFFYPLIKLLSCAYLRHSRRKHPEIHRENWEILSRINTMEMLAARTVIVEATK